MKQHSKHTPVLRLSGVSKHYLSHGNVYTALDGVELTFFPGELSLMLGPSGSGKTTLLTIAAGFVRPSTGTVDLFGRALTGYGAKDLQVLRARHIGFVFQTFLLIDALTAMDNVLLQLRFAGLKKSIAHRRAMDALERVDIADLGQKRPSELSHGEQQRVAIARALAVDADLVIADEPTASLDMDQGENIISLLHSCARELNKCVLVASHDLRLRTHADHIHLLENGSISHTQNEAL
ncbi:ABC transporter ATP-binding protein [bacterium]|nr:ABC transporter ATP-binding protein [bacterium]